VASITFADAQYWAVIFSLCALLTPGKSGGGRRRVASYARQPFAYAVSVAPNRVAALAARRTR